MKAYEEFMTKFGDLLLYDEPLMRLLYYPAKSSDDDVLQITKDRPRITPPFIAGTFNIDPNVSFIGEEASDQLRRTLVYNTRKVYDLEMGQKDPCCRLVFYLGHRQASRNFKYPMQEIVTEIYVHVDIDNIDYRLAKLCDHTTQLVDGKNLGGLGRVFANGGDPIILGDQYTGFRLYFSASSERS